MRDAGFAWGVDTGSNRAGLAYVDLEDGSWQTNAVSWPRPPGSVAKSLDACRMQLESFSRRMAGEFPPSTVCFELPTGRPNPSLMMHAGAIISGVYAGTGLGPWKCTPPEWKRALFGDGQMPKHKLAPWAVSLGAARPDDDDQTAALAVAIFGAKKMFGFTLDDLGSQLPRNDS